MQLYQEYKNKKVLVTGHTGFKGAWLVAILNKLGADVMGYALAPEENSCIYNEIEGSTKCKSILSDIRDKIKLEQVIIDFQPDFVFHMAAQALVIKSYAIPTETFDVNVVGTANLLEAIQRLNKKCSVVIITTDKVYENKELKVPFRETNRLGGNDPYSASKACTELVVSSFRNSFFNLTAYQNHQKAIASVRAGNVIGGGDYSENRLIPDIIRALSKNETIVVRNPKSIRPWQHVLEPLFAYLKLGLSLAKEPKKYSIAFNIGPLPDDNLTVEDLVIKAIKIWGNGDYRISEKEKLHEAETLKLDITLASQYLNWTPLYNSSEAILKTIQWYQSDNKIEITNQQIDTYLHALS